MMSLKSFFVSFVCVASLAVSFSSCRHQKTYAEYLEDEEDMIDAFIERKKIFTVNFMPTQSTEWLTPNGDPVYYKFSDGLYFHLIEKGDTTTLAPNVGNTVTLRYVGKNMDGVIVYDWSEQASVTPTSLRILSTPTASNIYGEGFIKAVRCLYAGGHCTAIIPFKIGNGYNSNIYGGVTSDSEDRRPMFYEIWVSRIE
ncbi:MAG: DUF4827 family protein [Paludibacteraceae bacterium]|nr:DUF4827 family protein [Paludibacteraceae bacterium]